MPSQNEIDTLAYLKAIDANMAQMKQLLTRVVNYMIEAESEIPEKMRRFITYMHDVHDVVFMYENRGNPVPAHVLRELERCDDRYRQLLEDLNTDGAQFEQVRRDMTKRGGNRWDHSRMLPKQEPKA